MRRAVPGMRVLRVGVGAAESVPASAVMLSVGLGGALTDEHAPGTVVVPNRVFDESGQSWPTDPPWSAVLRAAARRLGLPATDGTLVATTTIATGRARAALAARGYTAVDMESAAIAAVAPRLAVLRVVLDTPSHEISPRWRRPATAAFDPRLWPQGLRLTRTAPRFAARAAAVLAEALRRQALERDVHPQV